MKRLPWGPHGSLLITHPLAPAAVFHTVYLPFSAADFIRHGRDAWREGDAARCCANRQPANLVPQASYRTNNDTVRPGVGKRTLRRQNHPKLRRRHFLSYISSATSASTAIRQFGPFSFGSLDHFRSAVWTIFIRQFGQNSTRRSTQTSPLLNKPSTK